MVQLTQDIQSPFDPANVAWEMADRFGNAICEHIRGPNGEQTGFGMVYGYDNDKWQPVRPVHVDRYQPVETETIYNAVAERFPVDESSMRVMSDRSNCLQRLFIPFGEEIEVARTPFDIGTDYVANGQPVKTDTLRPMFEVTNSYAALTKVIFKFGFLRMICENGMVVFESGLEIKNMHTEMEIERFMRDLSTVQVEKAIETVVKMTDAKISEKELKRLMAMLPKKHAERMQENVDLAGGTVWGAYNFLTYLRSHEYSVGRTNQLDRPLSAAYAMARAA